MSDLSRRRLLAGGVEATALLGMGTVASFTAPPRDVDPRPAGPAVGAGDWHDVRSFRDDADADDTASIRRAVAAALAAGGGVVWFGSQRTYKISGRLDLPVGYVGYRGDGVTIDCVNVPDSEGYAIRFVPAADLAGPASSWTYAYTCEGLRVVGPSDPTADTSRALDGIYIGRPADMTAGDCAGASFRNMYVAGFRDNWVIGNQTWLLKWDQCAVERAWRYGMNVLALVNAGENYNLHGGVFAACAVAIRADVAANADLYLFGVSLDYNGRHLALESGSAALVGCHLEDRNTGPMVTVASTGGYEPAKLDLVACAVSGTETVAGGRDSFVTVTGGRSIVRISGGSWPRYDKQNSELVTVSTGAGRPLVVVEHVDPVVKDNATPRISGYTSILPNGGFGSGLAGWTLSGGTSAGSHAVDTSVRRSGSASLKITKSTAGGYGFHRDVAVAPGARLLLRGYLRTAALSGDAHLRIDWLDWAGSEVAAREDYVGGTITGTNAGWVQRSSSYAVPAGAARARVWVWTTAGSGTVWFDDLEAWLL